MDASFTVGANGAALTTVIIITSNLILKYQAAMATKHSCFDQAAHKERLLAEGKQLSEMRQLFELH